MRRLRARRARGAVVLQVEVADLFELSDLLVETGRLESWDAENHEEVARAVSQVLDIWTHVTRHGVDPLPRAIDAETD